MQLIKINEKKIQKKFFDEVQFMLPVLLASYLKNH